MPVAVVSHNPTIIHSWWTDGTTHCIVTVVSQESTPSAPPPLVHNALHTRRRLVRTAKACWWESHGLRRLLVHHLLLPEGRLLLLLHLVVVWGKALVVPLQLTLRARRLLLPGQLRPLLLLLGPLLGWLGKAQASTRRGLLLEGPLLGCCLLLSLQLLGTSHCSSLLGSLLFCSPGRCEQP